MEAFIKIPNAILQDKDLNHTQMILFGVITSLSNNKAKKCRASNKYLGELLNVDDRTIRRNLKVLSDKGYIVMGVDKNVLGGGQKCPQGRTIMSTNNISNNIIDLSYDKSLIREKCLELYNNYYGIGKGIDEDKCDKIIKSKLEQGVTLEDMKIGMMLYNTECRIKQEYTYVKKFENWIKGFQPLTQEQIDEMLTRLVREHKKKKESDPKYTKGKLAKTVWNDLCNTFGKDRVNEIFKSETSSKTILNFT